MKAVGYRQHGLPISDPRALEDLELADPVPPKWRDLLVRVHAVHLGTKPDRRGVPRVARVCVTSAGRGLEKRSIAMV